MRLALVVSLTLLLACGWYAHTHDMAIPPSPIAPMDRPPVDVP